MREMNPNYRHGPVIAGQRTVNFVVFSSSSSSSLLVRIRGIPVDHLTMALSYGSSAGVWCKKA
jgi:hypothetical protein